MAKLDLRADDLIVEISEQRKKFFGCSGKMLVPCPATIAALLEEVPAGRLITTELIRKLLAERFGVQAICPAATNKGLQAISRDPVAGAAYWRVVKKHGELIDRFAGGVESQAARLAREGFIIDTNGKAPKVRNFKARLVSYIPRTPASETPY
jgi:alkylated DNA nucleotide flippase Atl1